jgi:hypothetical protein
VMNAFVTTFAFSPASDGSGTNIFAGTSNGDILASTNNGANWTAVNPWLTPSAVKALAVSPASGMSGTNLFAGSTFDGVFLSANNGRTWHPANTGLPGGDVLALATTTTSDGSGTNIFAATSSSGVFLSTNNGTLWTAVNAGLTDTSLCAFAVSPAGGGSGNYLFAGTARGGVFLSRNNGTSWTPVNTGFEGINVNFLAVNGNNLFAGTQGGVWKRPIAEMVTGVKGSAPNAIPDRSALEQNYPNPFNPSTRIEFQLAAPGFVSLKVYDVLGKEVKTLVNEERNAGSYEATFDATGLASGTYFYRLKAGGFTQSKKLLLLR